MIRYCVKYKYINIYHKLGGHGGGYQETTVKIHNFKNSQKSQFSVIIEKCVCVPESPVINLNIV